MSRTRPFLITIDTEGDNVWSKPRIITTRNAAFLPRFQTLCERYGLTPTWLVDYDMARDPVFAEFGRDVIARGAGEIGMHLHAWRTPPGHPLTSTDHEFMPFLIEYPESVLRAKVDFLTDLLETTFGVKIVSHRAGRWAFNDTYARALARRGFRVDCSVTPGVDWSDTLGDPGGQGGSDYSRVAPAAYALITDEASQATLWEVPVTIRPAGGAIAASVGRAVRGMPFSRKVWNRLYPLRWFRPRRGNRGELLTLLREAIRDDLPYVEFTIHSSELMPGGSPTFADLRSIERLYEDLHAVFEEARSVGLVGWPLGHYAGLLDSARALASG